MSIILIVFGLIFVYAGVQGWRESREHFGNAHKTEASIVAVRETTIQTDGGWHKAYQAIYAYRDKDDNEHRLRGRHTSTRKGAFPIGTSKTVYYNPDSPEEVQDTPAKEFSGLIIAIVAGVGMLAFGAAALFFGWSL
ncbi:MAG: DUF3592 domain-containing protein [Pseudomonadota bacterium]